jgi:hypothetical protein
LLPPLYSVSRFDEPPDDHTASPVDGGGCR